MRMVAKPGFKPVLFGTFCGIFLLSAVLTQAQATRNITSAGRRLDEFTRQNDKIARDQMESEMRGRKPTAEERRLAEAKNVQVKEDFAKLQDAYNDIVTRLSAREKLSRAYVAESADNISKIAERLRSNLPFPAKPTVGSENSKPEPAPPTSIVALCKEILSFLTNPMFEKSVVFDISAAEKARTSLENILRIADHLRHQTANSA